MGVLENRRSALSESRIARSIPLATAHCLCFSRFLFLRSFALTSRPTSPPELRRPPRARSVPRPVFVAERDSWLTTSSYFHFFFLLLSTPVKKKVRFSKCFFVFNIYSTSPSVITSTEEVMFSSLHVCPFVWIIQKVLCDLFLQSFVVWLGTGQGGVFGADPDTDYEIVKKHRTVVFL